MSLYSWCWFCGCFQSLCMWQNPPSLFCWAYSLELQLQIFDIFFTYWTAKSSPSLKTNEMDQLNYQEQQTFQKIVEQKQMADFMRLYTSLVDRCFNDCVQDFTSESLTSRESTCLTKCSEKFLKHSERVGTRFQEQNQKLMTQLK